MSAADSEDSCPVITYYRNSEPRKMIIDFGSACEGKDGKVRQIVSGIVLVTKGEESWSIDYGQGDCDNKAANEHDGISKEILTGRKKFSLNTY